MNACLARLAALLLLSAVPVSGVPSFVIDLDKPPEHRWDAVAEHFKDKMVAMSHGMYANIKGALKGDLPTWLAMVKKSFPPEHIPEMEGIVRQINSSNVTLDHLILTQVLYEIGSPTLCSSTLWADKNGQVIHGRNMDYANHWKMPDGRKMNWPDITFEGEFHKGGKPLMTFTSWAGGVGIATGMRRNKGGGGWTFDQQTRANDFHLNLGAGLQGGLPYGSIMRQMMTDEPDFQKAVDKTYAIKFMAPQYFIMTGSKPYEGAVLAIDRMGKHLEDTPPIQYLSGALSSTWHLVQTNDDLLETAADPRRPIANKILETMNRNDVNVDNMMKFMHNPPLFDPLTVYTSVMVPATGYYKTTLPKEPPFATPRALVVAAVDGLGLKGALPQDPYPHTGVDVGKIHTGFHLPPVKVLQQDVSTPNQSLLAKGRPQLKFKGQKERDANDDLASLMQLPDVTVSKTAPERSQEM